MDEEVYREIKEEETGINKGLAICCVCSRKEETRHGTKISLAICCVCSRKEETRHGTNNGLAICCACSRKEETRTSIGLVAAIEEESPFVE